MRTLSSTSFQSVIEFYPLKLHKFKTFPRQWHFCQIHPLNAMRTWWPQLNSAVGSSETYLRLCSLWLVTSYVQELNSLPRQLSLRKTFSGWDMLLSITGYWQCIALQKLFTERMIRGVHAIFKTMLNWGWLWTDSSETTLFLMSPGEIEWGELLSVPLILNLGDVPKHIAYLNRHIPVKISLLMYVNF